MSDTDHEDPENPDAEPDEAIEGDDADAEEEEEKPQTPREAADAEGSAEIAKQLKAATQGYHTRVSNLLGKDMENRICPTCDGFGFAEAPVNDGPPPMMDETKAECPVCNGYGQLLTPSRNPDHLTAVCVQCSGQGFVTKTVDVPPAYAPVTQLPTGLTAQQGTLLPDGRFLPYGATEPIQIPPAYAG